MKIALFTLLLILHLHASERIVSLSPSLTEIVFALGKGDELVGVSSYSDFPEAAKSLPVVGGYTNPNLEKIIALKPTLVIGQHYNQKIFSQLEHFGISTMKLRLERLEEIKKTILILSKRLGSESGEALVQAIDTAIAEIEPAEKSERVLIVYGLSEDLRRNNYVAHKGIFFDDIITLCGHENAFKSALDLQPVLSYENVIALNPDRIIILHSQRTEAHVNVEKALEAWRTVPTAASKAGKITAVSESYIHIPSHRVAQSITRLCREMQRD
jgi:iron complex transport system substrate-binding protein